MDVSQWIRAACAAVVLCASAGADGEQRQRRNGTSHARSTARARRTDAGQRLDNGEHAACFALYRGMIEDFGIRAKIAEADADIRDPALTNSERETLLAYGRCADGAAQAVHDPTERYERIVEALWAFEHYAKIERRPEEARIVRAVTDRVGDLMFSYAELVDTLAMPPSQPTASAVRVPVTFPRPEPTPEDRFRMQLDGARRLLAGGHIAMSYTSYVHLARDPIGRAHPDVAWGMAKTVELSIARLDDVVERLSWMIVARDWYRRYLATERRPEHRVGADARTTLATLAVRALDERIARIEQGLSAEERVRARAFTPGLQGPLEGSPLRAAPSPSPSAIGDILPVSDPPPPRHPAGDDDDDSRGGVPPADPAVVAEILASAPSDYTETIVSCFLAYGMARHGFVYLLRAQHFAFRWDLPPATAVCPPSSDG